MSASASATSAKIVDHATKAETNISGWSSLYRVAAVAVILIVLLIVLDFAATFLPSGSIESGTFTVTDWFALLQDKTLLALRNLGILNVLSLAFTVPVYLALYTAHRHINPAYAALAAILGFSGIVIYIANNPALPLLHLSEQYAATSVDTERTLFLAAGQALLAQAEDFTPGSFIGFLIPTLGWMTMAGVILRGGIFSKATGWAMVLGSACLLVFVVCATFIPSLFETVMILAMVGGILNLAGYILIAQRLLQLAKVA